MSSSDIEEIGRRWNETVRHQPTSQLISEGAELLRLHPETLRGYVVSGEVPACRIGSGRKASWRLNKIRLLNTLGLQVDLAAMRDNEWHRTVSAMPDWCSTDEAAYILRLHPDTVRTLARRGEIPATRIGPRGSWMFWCDNLLDLVGVLQEFQPRS